MIYIYTGNDNKKKNLNLKKLLGKEQPIFLLNKDTKKEEFINYAGSTSLFGEKQIVIVDSIIKEGNIIFSKDDILILNESENLFVFLEEKLNAEDLKKFKNNSIIEDFKIEEEKKQKINVFGIADSFSRRDKMGTWILYRDIITQDVSSEEISGIIFWKIKTMLLTGTKVFSTKELKTMSSNIVSMYHRAHNGELDFAIGLEQFILSSLSK
jgi:hypothetical protein